MGQCGDNTRMVHWTDIQSMFKSSIIDEHFRLPTRSQQLGLLILLVALTVYVFLRTG